MANGPVLASPAAIATKASRRPGLWTVFRTLLGIRLAVFALAIIGLTTFLAIAAPVIAQHDPIKNNVRDSLVPPSPQYWLGTDKLGRDQFSRVVHGARVSLVVSLGAVGLGMALGIALGAVAGYYRGLIDDFLMRLMDAKMAFPSLLLALALLAALGPGLLPVIIAIGINLVPIQARLMRSQVLSARSRDYVVAAEAMGAGSLRIMVQHLIPNCLAPGIVQGSLGLGFAILTEASLSFLGVGIRPPDPTWGSMLRSAFQSLETAPWLSLAPGLSITLLVLAFNFLGDALRDVLDPRLRGTLG